MKSGKTGSVATETTIFGYNTSNNDVERVDKINWWGRVPCGRTYYGPSSLPSNGSGFLSGGKEYKGVGLDIAGTVSSKRLNVCFRIDPTTIVSSSSARVVEAYDYVRSIPSGWRIYLTDHEYNRFIIGSGTTDETYQAADYVRAFQILADQIWQANQLNKQEGKGEGIFVVNSAGSGLGTSNWQDSWAPAAATMPPNCQFWADAYDNPNGKPTNYKNYGTYYNNVTTLLDDVYDTAQRLGYLNNSDGGTRGWGIGEFCAPRRVAPALATLDSTLGWGPLSPHDISGAGQAQSITDYATWCLGTPGRPIPAKVVLLWSTESGTNWNQSLQSAGSISHDDGTAGSPGPHYQGWPISVSPTLPVNAYQPFINMSA